MTRRQRSARGAFTLLEILIATGLLGGALVAVAGAVQSSGRRVMEARRLVVAARLARARMAEALAAKDPDDIAGSGADKASGMAWNVAVRQEAFELVELSLDPKTRVVEVEVRWPQGDRVLRLVGRRHAPSVSGVR